MKQIQKLGNWRQLAFAGPGVASLRPDLRAVLRYRLPLFRGGQRPAGADVVGASLHPAPRRPRMWAPRCAARLVLYLPWSLACCGLAWLLLGHPAAAVPVALVCFFRGKNRLSEEPVESMMDRPSPPLTAPGPGALFLQRAGRQPPAAKAQPDLGGAVLAAVRGPTGASQRLDHYLELNRGHGWPARPADCPALPGLALAGMLVLAAGLLLPALTLEDSYLRIDPSPPERTSAVRLEEITPASGGMEVNMAEALQQEFGEPPKMNPVVQFILGAVLCVIGGGFGVYLLYLVIRNFRGTFVDQRGRGAVPGPRHGGRGGAPAPGAGAGSGCVGPLPQRPGAPEVPPGRAALRQGGAAPVGLPPGD